jgi:subtilisin family serine protease
MGLIVVVNRDADRDAFLAQCAGLDVRPFEGLPRHFLIMGVTPETFAIANHPDIEVIEPDDLPVKSCSQSITIDDDLSGGSWAILRAINRDPPWNTKRIVTPVEAEFDCYRRGRGVDIYHFDSGIRTTHEEFGGRATNVYEFFDSGEAGDDNGHGTRTSSCAAGETVGLARDALIFSFKCLDSTNSGSTAALIAAAGEALTHYQGRSALNRPAVANFSLRFTSSAANSAIADLIDAGMVCVAAVANDGVDLSSISSFPAEATDVIAVGGIGMADIPYYNPDVPSGSGVVGTNYGTRVDILAPSQTVYTASFSADDTYGLGHGTSMGCPIVTGVLACMLEGYRRLTSRSEVQIVRDYLIAQATTGRFRTAFGFSPLPDAIVYLDRSNEPPRIVGLTKLVRPDDFALPEPVLRSVGTADPVDIDVLEPEMGAPGVIYPPAFGAAGVKAVVAVGS